MSDIAHLIFAGLALLFVAAVFVAGIRNEKRIEKRHRRRTP